MLLIEKHPGYMPTEFTENDNDLDVDTKPPSLDEGKNAIRHLKSRIVPDTDRISAEMSKAGEEVTSNALTKIFKEIWNTEVNPDVCKTGLTVKSPKKKDLCLCNNWRGIVSITSKVFTRLIFDRISTAVDPLFRKDQAGFMKGKSCSDNISTLRQILEKGIGQRTSRVPVSYIKIL